MATQRRTQQERRNETQSRVLQTACRLFGEKGYANTSLEDIAQECGLTIRPIYHYFGNKKNLFAAVTEYMEQQLVQSLENSLAVNTEKAPLAGWQAFLDMSANHHFRRVVLVDAPNILGRERWASSAVIVKVREIFRRIRPGISPAKSELLLRMLIAALAEAALMTVEMENPDAALVEVASVIEAVMAAMGKS
jgi:AcrR family transcriptional regulator